MEAIDDLENLDDCPVKAITTVHYLRIRVQ